MSVSVLEFAYAALRHAHALFGQPSAPAPLTVPGGAPLSAAVERAAAARHRVTALTGHLPQAVGAFDDQATGHLATLAGTDGRLTSGVHAAAVDVHAGRAASGRVLQAAAVDVTRRGPQAVTAAGQRALLVALRDRVTQQQRLVAAHQARDARLAAALRALSYAAPSPATARRTTLGPRLGARPAVRSTTRLDPRWPGDRPVWDPGGPASSSVRLSARSGPREVAARLVQECRRRGYTPAQTCAILATMLQESGGNPRAVSANGLWRGVFQQDASYAGRDDPDTSITEFLDRLDAKGGPASPDVWKSIFWLQQAPGMASADAALASGRRGYLREIQTRLAQAVMTYRDVGGD